MKKKQKVNNTIIGIICGAIIAIVGIVIAIVIVSKNNNSDDLYVQQQTDSNSSSNSGELQLSDSGWSYIQDTKWGNYVSFGVAIYNPVKGSVGSFPTIKVVGRDSNNKILFSDEFSCSLDYIYYGETLYCGGSVADQVEKPSKIEFNISVRSWKNESAVNYPRNTDFVIENVSLYKEYTDIKFTGEIKNNSNVSINSAHIVTIFKKDGKIVGGYMSYSDSLNAKSSDTFQIYVSPIPDYDSYEITANVAMIN